MDIPKQYDPKQAELHHYERWEKAGYFAPEINKDPGAPVFTIVIPPPNVTGSLHMGHALQHTLMDVLTRYKRMSGFRTLWLPGMDHAGISTQLMVTRALKKEGKSRHDLGREKFVERVWQWKAESGGQITVQMRREGASVDWSREKFTMDEPLSRAVREVFVRLYEEGMIYRGNRIVNWCPQDQTVLSDLEVDKLPQSGKLYYLQYQVKGSERRLTVATTRPETMLGDTAVAVNPSDERYTDLLGATLLLPLTDRQIPVIADEFVDPEFGTGAVKVTPAHDPNDYEMGVRHNLAQVVVIDQFAKMTADAGESFAGLDRYKARDKVVEEFEQLGLLEKVVDYEFAISKCERCKTVIEPLISTQWFMNMEQLRDLALDLMAKKQKPQFVPEVPYERVYTSWLENLRDWTISRQLWWGHQIPAWYTNDGRVFVARTEAEAREKAGTDELTQDPDVLDTWFSSALWPFSTLGWPNETDDLKVFYPSSVLVTARDIIFLWVARMVMMGLEFAGDIPFDDVYITPVIQAADGRRMSKSLGTGIDPLDEIDNHGADGVRFGLLAMSSTQDVRYSAERIQQGQDLANKLWNASRLVLLNAAPDNSRQEQAPVGAPGGTSLVQGPPSSERVEDRWIVSRLQRAIEGATASIASYDFAHAALDLYDYFWSELCDWYLEIVKPRLYDGDPDASATLLWVLEQTLALLHPVMPFVTEEIYSYLRGELGDDAPEMLVVHSYPEMDPELIDEQAEREVQAWIDLTRQVRRWRDLVGVAAASVLPARVSGGDATPPHELVGRLARLSFDGAEGEALATFGSVEILPSEDVDAEQVRHRIAERRDDLLSEVARAEGKLSNARFVDKAPADVVEAERAKLARYQAELEELHP